MRCVAMYRFGDNPSHALISLTPIVDDSGAQVEWPFMADPCPSLTAEYRAANKHME